MALRRHQHIAEARERAGRGAASPRGAGGRAGVGIAGTLALAFAWWPIVTLTVVALLALWIGALESGLGVNTESLRYYFVALPDVVPVASFLLSLIVLSIWAVRRKPGTEPRTSGARRLIVGVFMAKVALSGLVVSAGIIPETLIESRNVGLLGTSLFGLLAMLFTMTGRQTARMIFALLLVADVVALAASLAFVAVDPAHVLPWSYWLLALAVLVDFAILAGIVIMSNRINQLCRT